jgi:arylsulfatase A-like enzyme
MLAGAVVVAAIVASSAWIAVAADRPNVLVIVADDLGYGDVGCYGATRIATPSIDRLAAGGVRCLDAHAPAAVCQPSRYAILSGEYHFRAGHRGDQSLYFRDAQPTLASIFRAAGYRTAAIGKWHLGFGRGGHPDYNAELSPGPLDVGFDSFFGCPRTHNEPPFVFVEDRRVVGLDSADPLRIIAARDTPSGRGWGHGISEGAVAAHAARPLERIDPILADKAAAFVAAPSAEPFLLYLAFLAPHVPIAPSEEFQGASQAGDYGDFIQQLDACVGKVLAALEASGRDDDTLVFFVSDNGGLYMPAAIASGHRPNGPFLGQKTDAWEGGHRVPFIARWPGHLPAATTCSRMVGLTDIVATACAAAGIAVPPGAAVDSLDQLPVLTAPATVPAVRREMLIQGTGGYALRQNEWLYLPKQGSMGFTVQSPPAKPWGQPYSRMGVTTSDVDAEGRIKPEAPAEQLYDVATDPRQARNLFKEQPARAARMTARLAEILGR